MRAKLSFFVDSHNFFLSGVIIVNGLQLMNKICNNLLLLFWLYQVASEVKTDPTLANVFQKLDTDCDG